MLSAAVTSARAMAERAELPMPRVYVMNNPQPNAFATGRNPENAHVAATRGLLNKLDSNELEAVMAHEMCHVGNYDTRLLTAVAVVVGLSRWWQT